MRILKTVAPLVRTSASKLRPPSQLFSAASASMNAHGAFAFPEVNGRNREPLFGFGDKHNHKSVIDILEQQQSKDGDKTSRIGKTNIGSIILRPSLDMVSKLAIGTLITALLTILIEKSIGITSIASIAKDEVTKIKNDTIDAITKYMIKNASEKIQTGDTTVIASIYGRISSDTRKNMLKKLVIDGVSYGWLAEYDGIIDQWLNKIIEIKGGDLPSDKYILDIISIIQNKVLPVTNGIWYFKRAVRLRTGLGVTTADTAPDSYWYTSEGQTETAKGVRETLADDTTIAKIVVGLLSAAESFNSIRIKRMLIKLINNFKGHIASASVEKMKIPGKLGLILEEEEEYPQSTIAKSKSNSKSSKSSKSSESFETRDTDINMQILELNKNIKKCEKYLVDYTKTSKIRNSLRTSVRSHSGRVKSSPKSPESMRALRTFTSFGLGGGRETRITRRDSKSKISSHNRSRKVVRIDRHRTRKR
jgi:hypothetical protein